MSQTLHKTLALFLMDPSNSNRKFVLDYIENAIQKDPQIIDCQNSNGETLLHSLARYHNLYKNTTMPIVNALIKNKANPFVENKQGFTPRMMIQDTNNPLYALLSAYEDKMRTQEMAKALEGLAAFGMLLKNSGGNFVERQDIAKNQVLAASRFLKGNQNSL